MRARYPDREGVVESRGVPIFYETYGTGGQTVALLPPWQIVHSRIWKTQVAYLARHFRVVTYDPPGNGRSGRPAGGFDHDRAAADALAVLDATGTPRASLVCLSRSCWPGVILAAQRPERVDRLVLTGCALAEAPRGGPAFHERRRVTHQPAPVRAGKEDAMKRWVLLGWTLATILTASAVFAETCLSPYVKGLRQPEKVMYLWTLPANGPGPDYLSVVDVNLASPTYGKIVKKVEVGSTGNEAHHIGFTDDRTKIWAASLNTSRLFIFDVGADPTSPRLARTIDDVPRLTGLSGPHTPYAIPGRVLVSMASGPDGTGPGGLAEFTNDGEFVASHKAPNHPYETVVKPEFNRMVTSSWVSQRTFMSPLAKWDPKDFSSTLLVWDLKARKIVQELKGDPIPLAARWMLKPNANYGYNISNGGDSIWMFRMQKDGTFGYKKVADLGKGCGAADLRQSPDDRYLYVSCAARGEVQAWDIGSPDKPRLHDTVEGLVQANMMHMTYDGRRLYVTNSLISSIDFSPRYALRLIRMGPDGRMKLDPFFAIDFSRAPDGPARPHDMLLN